jgi:alpha-beta hydrolase superfamily lysophospholipase
MYLYVSPIADYLFGARKRTDATSKFDQIMENLHELLLEKYPDYKIYVTGHSLGGALSTLLAFRLAALEDDHINKPITCLTIASPRVGNLDLRRAFQVNLANLLSLSCDDALLSKFWRTTTHPVDLFIVLGVGGKRKTTMPSSLE